MKSGSSRNALLWSIEGEACCGVSYLMGTMHVRDRRAFRRWQQVTQKVDACTAFAAEIQIDQLKELPAQLPAATPLRYLLPDSKFRKLQRQLLKGAGIDLATCDHLPPIIILQLVDEALMTRDFPASLDESLWDYAKKQDKDLLGLESVEAQHAFLQQLNRLYQAPQLLDISSRWSSHYRQTRRLAELFEAEEIDKLYQSARQGAGHLRKTLLLERNRYMADQLAGLVRRQSVFCAVGAAHLGGGKGMLRWLKKAGLVVKPVPPF